MDTIAPRPEEFSSHEDAVDDVELSLPSIGELPATVAMSEAEKAAISKRLERLAADSREAHRREVSWQQDGRQYSAVLVRQQASDGSALEQVVADVSTSDRGRNLTTRVNLRRLAFSQFTQMVDTWDPMVQLHDDEIVGRFHSNSQLKLLHDASTAPRFSGKVTTAALEPIRFEWNRRGLRGTPALSPGSGLVRAQAEAEGIAQKLIEAGFDWRMAGCSMCLGINPDQLAPGERCASTSNRNFEGRQGRGGRTHLLSPAIAAAAAVTGHLTDVRELM
jgi:hypothetical protein